MAATGRSASVARCRAAAGRVRPAAVIRPWTNADAQASLLPKQRSFVGCLWALPLQLSWPFVTEDLS